MTEAKIGFCGDIMSHFGFVIREFEGHPFGAFFSEEVRCLCGEHDEMWGNLEGPAFNSADSLGIYQRLISKRSSYPKLFFPSHYVAQLQSLNFTTLGIANNHTFDDETSEGPLETVEVLNNLGFDAPGLAIDPVVRVINDISFAIFSVTTFLNPPYIAGPVALVTEETLPTLLTVIEHWAKKVDYVVIMIHWGNDYQRFPSRRIRSLAGELLKAGARIIYGNHPHILWPIEQPAPHQIVCYSLGNFSQVIGCPSRHRLAPIYFKALTSGILTLKISKERISAKFQPTRTLENIDQWLAALGLENSYWLWDQTAFHTWYNSIGTPRARLLSELRLLSNSMPPPGSMEEINPLYAL